MRKVTLRMASHTFFIRPRQTLVAHANSYRTHK